MMAWLRVFLLGVIKLPMKVIAPFAYPFINPITNPVFGVRDANDLSWYNIAIRNGCHNLFTIDQPEFTTRSNSYDHTLEKLDCFQWRYRKSLDGKYVSFRCTWGEPRNKGKKEFYIGWTMNAAPYARLTFFQLRPF